MTPLKYITLVFLFILWVALGTLTVSVAVGHEAILAEQTLLESNSQAANQVLCAQPIGILPLPAPAYKLMMTCVVQPTEPESFTTIVQ